MLTKNFTLQEVTFSEYATRHNIDNSLPPRLLTNVQRQAELMEKIRYELNAPIFITSWYRCPELNHAIGGAPASFHQQGLACDFVSPFGTPLEICKAIMKSGIEFDQCILEFNRWVHIGLSNEPLRQEVLTAILENKKTKYLPGLIE